MKSKSTRSDTKREIQYSMQSQSGTREVIEALEGSVKCSSSQLNIRRVTEEHSKGYLSALRVVQALEELSKRSGYHKAPRRREDLKTRAQTAMCCSVDEDKLLYRL